MTNTNLRIPDELYEKLKEIAEREDRSINGQMVHIIRKYIEEFEKAQES
jgi:predicted DNA-binding protein